MLFTQTFSFFGSFPLRRPTAALSTLLMDLLQALLLIAFLASAASTVSLVREAADIHVYESIAKNVQSFLNGQTMSASSEYPPLATSFFSWIAHNSLGTDFAVAWLIVLVSAVSATALYTAWFCGLRSSLQFLMAILVSFWLLGDDVVYARFDIYLFLLCFLSWRAHCAQRHVAAGCFLGLATCLKAIPILAIPMLIVSTPKQERMRAVTGLLAAGILAGVLCWATLGIPYTVKNVLYFVQYHHERGVLIESMWSGVAMLFANIAGQMSTTGFDHMSITNTDIPSAVATIAKGLILGFTLLMIVLMMLRRPEKREYGPAMIVLLLGFLGLSPVLSPQFFVWVVPLLLFWSLETLGKGRRIGAALVVGGIGIGMAAGTQWIYPDHYFGMVGQEKLLPTIILNLRNFAVFAAMPMLLGWSLPTQTAKATTRSPILAFEIRTALFGAACALLLFGLPLLVPRVTSVQYALSGEPVKHTQSLPVRMQAEDRPLQTTIRFVMPAAVGEALFRFKPDDCLESVTVNGAGTDIEPFCDADGRVVNLGAYVHTGENSLTATVRDEHGGGMGLGFSGASRGTGANLVIGAFLAALLWYAAHVLLTVNIVIRRFCDHSSDILRRCSSLFSRHTSAAVDVWSRLMAE